MFPQKIFKIATNVLFLGLTFTLITEVTNINSQAIAHPNGHSLDNSGKSNPQLSDTEIIDNILIRQEEFKLCDDVFQEDVIKGYSEVYTINEQEKLVQILCYSGAYQGAYQYFLVDSNEIKPLSLTEFTDNEKGEVVETQKTLITGLATYDETEQNLSIFNKYAGHGGCGTEAKYQWQESSFKLLEFRANFDCEKPINSEN